MSPDTASCRAADCRRIAENLLPLRPYPSCYNLNLYPNTSFGSCLPPSIIAPAPTRNQHRSANLPLQQQHPTTTCTLSAGAHAPPSSNILTMPPLPALPPLSLFLHQLLSPTPPAAALASYTSRYGSIFVWHGLLATLAWALLSPLGHVLSRLARRGSPSRAFHRHRLLMLLTLLLTLIVFALGVVFAPRHPSPPVAHRVLAVALVLAGLLQGAMGALRPDVKGGQARRWWRTAHRAWGAGTMALGAFLVHHSLIVFEVGGVVRWGVNALLGAMGLGVLVVHALGPQGEEDEGAERGEEDEGAERGEEDVFWEEEEVDALLLKGEER